MRGKRTFIAAAVAGLLTIAVTAATAANAASAPPVAAPHWHVVKTVKTDFTGGFTAVVATGKTTGWAFDGFDPKGGPTAWKRTGNTWVKVAFPGKSTEEVVTAGASSPSDVWAFTQILGAGSRVLHWNGHKWSVLKTFPRQINGATVVAANDVWVFGELGFSFSPALGVWHYNGHAWSQVSTSIQGGSALSATDAWGFNGTSVEHWNGHKWTATSVKTLLPAKLPSGLNDPAVAGVLAMSDKNVYAVGNGNAEDEGGPLVVLHYNGSKWSRVSPVTGFGSGPAEQFSSDGSGGLWLPMLGSEGGTSFLVHFTGGKLIKATLPVSAPKITIDATGRIPGTTEQLAGGFTHASGNRGVNVVAVLLQFS
jgi:hypothetical protein